MSANGPHSFHNPSDAIPADMWTFDSVEERLIEAMDVLLRSHDREQGWLRTATMSLWRQVAPDMTETAPDDRPIVTCALTRAEVARADEAMGWVLRAVPSGDTRRVVGIALVQLARGDQSRVDWSRVWYAMGGRGGGWTTDGLRMRYGRALTSICLQLNKAKSAI